MGKGKFEDRRMGVYCCGHLFRHERPALLVVHSDGDWQFLCGGMDHSDALEPYHVSVGILIDADSTLQRIADLPPGSEAERRSIGEAWMRTSGVQ